MRAIYKLRSHVSVIVNYAVACIPRYFCYGPPLLKSLHFQPMIMPKFDQMTNLAFAIGQNFKKFDTCRVFGVFSSV